MTSWGMYVGRVGGLAVALGIGMAIASGQGVASAESPSKPPDASESPQPPPESPKPSPSPFGAAGRESADGGVEGKRLSVPSLRPWSGQGYRKSASDETKDLRQDADELAVTLEGSLENSFGARDTDPPVRRSSLSSQHSTPNALQRWRSRVEHASPAKDAEVKAPSINAHSNAYTGGPAVDGRTFAREIDAVDPAGAQTLAFSAPFSKSLAPTAVDVQPLIARAAPTAANEPSTITRLLAPLGFGASATDAPLAPASPTTLMSVLELVRRELEQIFVNKTPTSTHNPGANIAANGAITGKVVGTDPDSTLTYTATSPAEGDVVIGPDGTFTFTPNENYKPNDGASFDVTISDESSGFHIHGLSGVLNLVTFGLVGESGHTHTQTVTVSGEVPPPDLQRTVVVSGLTEPTDFRFLPRINPDDPDEPDRILIAEKGGAIKVYNGSEVQTLTTLPVETYWARGINGIEVDPDFNENGYIYVSYIRNDTDPAKDNVQRLSRFTVTDPTADVLTIDPSTEKVLIEGTEPAGDDHHGGEIRYIDEGVLGDRSDDKIYYATGDNVCCSVVDGSRSQDLGSIYGKVLRINPDGTVPTDNPYYNVPGARQEIYATGLRNPFRGGVTPDGQLLLGDVGQNTWEEINLVSAGANFGWPAAEGVCPGPGVCQPPDSNGKTNPIYAYNEPVGGSSITSVLVYEGDGFGDRYNNAVFFADHNREWVKVMHCDAGYTSCGAPSTFISQGGRTTRLEQGPDGNIYQLTYRDGTLWRIAPSSTETSTV